MPKASKETTSPSSPYQWQSRIPLRQVRLNKPFWPHPLYATDHDVIMHDNPPGLRATLVDNTFVIVESPPHPNDKRGQPIHARIPINGGLISFIEDLIPVRHALDHDESLGLGRLAVEQSNKLGPQVGVTKEEAVKEAAKAESVPAPEAKRRGRPPKASPKVAEAIKRLHEDPPPDPTEEDKALLEDDEWDEKMEKAEAAREERLARLRGEVA